MQFVLIFVVAFAAVADVNLVACAGNVAAVAFSDNYFAANVLAAVAVAVVANLFIVAVAEGDVFVLKINMLLLLQ